MIQKIKRIYSSIKKYLNGLYKKYCKSVDILDITREDLLIELSKSNYVKLIFKYANCGTKLVYLFSYFISLIGAVWLIYLIYAGKGFSNIGTALALLGLGLSTGSTLESLFKSKLESIVKYKEWFGEGRKHI